ncbi:MAG: class I SAM-dependent methyltransferase [Candidatus Hydrogenedentes bacterium]|nr:class I SAM-dependent methyltransferase [Candidatus Hydrogenedentota bacterium]
MSDKPFRPAFDEEHAAAYDERFARLAPFKDALHLAMRGLLAELPVNARILSVGAGTGAELLYLANAFPGWTFTLVEPAPAMLNRCREKAAVAGINARCTFHEGYLDALPHAEPFDAATSILVSQFVLIRQKRVNYFQDIAARLKPEGHLVTADLAGEPGTTNFEAWIALQKYNGSSDEQADQYRTALKEHVAVAPPKEVADIITEGGFDTPTLVCQTLLIHMWHSRKGLGT